MTSGVRARHIDYVIEVVNKVAAERRAPHHFTARFQATD
jgi:hypothetical protein